ncbi:MAG: hypothetical protein EA382_04280 [Spirochaetaceae bacterium]|nr:MAG: hypothetical protein EA382_04280 [Spirochaetaceae bacterium]
MNVAGVIISFAFVFAVIGVAQALLRSGRLSASATRKVVHIGVAHWWLLAMYFFDRWEFAIIGPVAFVAINLASYLLRLFPAMEHEERSKNLGTIYFPIALTATVLLTWAGPVATWIGGVGILVLGYGDGMAAVIGERSKRWRFPIMGTMKSAAGTATMFMFSAVVAAAFLIVFADPSTLIAAGAIPSVSIALTAIVIAAVATVVEVLTPFGLDNLTVPIATTLLLHWITIS